MKDRKSACRAQLMARAQMGDREAFHALFKDIGPLITRSLRRHLPVSEVEDICQEVLIAVYKSRHTYEVGRPFEPWLFAITRRVTGRHLNRIKGRLAVEVAVDEPPEALTEGGSDLELRLREAFEQLPRRQFEAVGLTKILGLSFAEAARRTGTSIGSMKVRAHRAYESLKRSLRS